MKKKKKTGKLHWFRVYKVTELLHALSLVDKSLDENMWTLLWRLKIRAIFLELFYKTIEHFSMFT